MAAPRRPWLSRQASRGAEAANGAAYRPQSIETQENDALARSAQTNAKALATLRIGNWQMLAWPPKLAAGTWGLSMRRRVLAALAILGTLALAGCAGPCGFIWDDWFYPPKSCHRQHIGQ